MAKSQGKGARGVKKRVKSGRKINGRVSKSAYQNAPRHAGFGPAPHASVCKKWWPPGHRGRGFESSFGSTLPEPWPGYLNHLLVQDGGPGGKRL